MGRTVTAAHARGSVSIQLAVLAPVVFVFFALVTIAGRYGLARQAMDSAAFEAARNASQVTDATAAGPRAHDAALRSLQAQGIRCGALDVQVDLSGYAQPPGTPAIVTVTLTCQVDNTDIAAPGIPGHTTLTSVFWSPLDLYRARS
jgi:Flp pilus assembly protein TadG